MKTLSLIVSFSLLPFTNAFAAYQSFPVRNRIAIVHVNERGIQSWRKHQTRYDSLPFRVEVTTDEDGTKPETVRNGRPFIAANRDERFAVRLYNPLPIRVAVNLTIDGLNSLTGKPSGISDGDKWMIDPYSSITIRGWQVSGGDARRFFFTDKPKSYAQWTGDQAGKDLSVNCGVIGAAYFWNQKELDQYYDEHPQYRYDYTQSYRQRNIVAEKKSIGGASFGAEAANKELDSHLQSAAASAAAQEAGTGMGERESNPTTLVDFHYDTGMYQLAQAVVIYYDFVTPPVPNPFPAISYAPEMP